MKNDGGPAFPQHPVHAPQRAAGHWENVCGMSLRDWFAGQVLAGLLASSSYDCGPAGLAHDAYQQADAMLIERAKSTED